MAAPLSVDLIFRFSTCRRLLSPLVLSQTFIKLKSQNVYNNGEHKVPSRSFANVVLAGAPAVLNADKPYLWVPSRNYGRKVKPRPPKFTDFGYSGDLRNLPELDKSLILYKYRDVQHELEGNEIVKKLATLEFATAEDIASHRKQLIIDRIVELFGPDSELEQKIALLTFQIRVNIPLCIKYRTNKLNKTKLVCTIGHRRKLLTNLRSLDHERFEWLLRELKIRYVVPKDREEHKGWKHYKRVAVLEEAREKQRKKLEQLKAKFDSEKEIFYEHKAQVVSKIEEDLNKFGLDWDFLNNLIKAEKEALEKQQEEQKLQQLREAFKAKTTPVAKDGKRA